MDSVLLPNEIEIYVDVMQPQKMSTLGSASWLEWHQRIQKLNQEALVEASSLKEEHVKESLVSYQKTSVLIHEAILVNIWKYKVLPILLKIQPRPETTVIAYSILYHEAVCVSLLELVLFHPNCCETLDDYAIDLLDYSYGLASHLLTIRYQDAKPKESAAQELLRQQGNLEFEIGIRSLTIIRYLSENLDRLPLGLKAKLYTDNDVPILSVEILLKKPWIKKGKIYIGSGSWTSWDNEQLGQAEAQVWLTLRHLLLDDECTKMYQLTNARKTQLTKLLPLISPTLLDQLSPLIELKQWLCRVTLADTASNAHTKPFLFEPVLEIKHGILKECGEKWRNIAEKQVDVIFTSNRDDIHEAAKKLNEAYNTDLLEQFEIKAKGTCVRCGKGAIKRCSRCKKAEYCSRSCQVAHWQCHKEDCEAVASVQKSCQT